MKNKKCDSGKAITCSVQTAMIVAGQGGLFSDFEFEFRVSDLRSTTALVLPRRHLKLSVYL